MDKVDLSVAAVIAGTVLVVALLASVPGVIARHKKHHQAAAITVLSWLGIWFIGIGWVVALVWALALPDQRSTGIPASEAPRRMPPPARRH